MKTITTMLSLASCLAILAFGSIAQENVLVSTAEEVETSMKAVPCERETRIDAVRKRFADAGAADNEIETAKFDKDKISNVVVRKKGTTDETIVVGAHYDRTEQGCGAIDNWSGITILSHVYRSLRSLDTKKSYVFVAFDREEEGLKGSRQMVKAMTESDLLKTCSMVNFDSFGQGLPMALRNASSSKLLKLAKDIGKENNFEFIDPEIPGASSDSASFKEKKVPAITLSGLGRDWFEILHTAKDKIDRVNMQSVYMGYRFGLMYVWRLDSAGCQDYR